MQDVQDGSQDSDETLTAAFGGLWDQANQLWEEHQNAPAFERYVSADYLSVARALSCLKGRTKTFLEWGSGLGVATIMASRMGFDAYGIEAEEGLIHHAKHLAITHGSQATFGEGSFIPDAFHRPSAVGSQIPRTAIDIPDAYGRIGKKLREFDLVYVFPWPEEQALFRNIMQQFAGQGALLLCYDVRDGIQVTPFQQQRR